MTAEHATAAIAAEFSGAQIEAVPPERRGPGDAGVVVSLPVADWRRFAQFAKDTLGCRFFNFLSAVDWKELGLEVVARVDNLGADVGVLMKARLAPGSVDCPSIVPVYRGADWMERECYDMFGIRFAGHPDLRRILLSDDWEGHPLLKSYAVDTPHPPYR
jgi:NADH-quinone oxidoreductase subunit C